MAESLPLPQPAASSGGNEFGRPFRFGQTTGPRELARTLGAPSVVVTERASTPTPGR